MEVSRDLDGVVESGSLGLRVVWVSGVRGKAGAFFWFAEDSARVQFPQRPKDPTTERPRAEDEDDSKEEGDVAGTIAFTYDVSTAIGQARLYAGDTDPEGLNRTGGDRTRTDEEVQYLLNQHGNDPRFAAAALLDAKAAEYASQAISVKQGGLSQDFRQRSWQLRQSADALRARSGSVAWNPPSQDPPFTAGEGGTMDVW